MIRALILSIGQLGDRPILAVLLKSLLLTLAILAALGTALWFAVRTLATTWLDSSGSQLVATVAVIGSLALGWLLFRAVAIAVTGLFSDEIVVAVEAKYYPEALAKARNVPFSQSLKMGLGSAGRTLLVNLILIPAYILLLVTGVGTPILFFAANGWLLGRDLADMVAARHISAAEMKTWRGETSTSRFALGLIVTGLLSVPGINLVAPVIGAAMATHLFHGRKA